jgi:hypothetical protein
MLRLKLLRRFGERFSNRYIPDKQYLLLRYRRNMGRRLNLSNPQAFTEKIQWLKLNWRFDNLTQCADKNEARKFVQDRIGPEVLKEVYGIYEKPEDIDVNQLPDAFVLKVNHGSKQNIFCRNKTDLDWNHCVRLLKKYLKANYYYPYREWAYKNIAPRIICEEHLTRDGEILHEYGFYCYDGIPRLVEINEYQGESHRVNMFDLDLNLLENKYSSPPLPVPFARTPQFDKILEYATTLSAGFPFVRADLLCVKNRIYFGEMTFYPLAGLCRLDPDSFDYFLGSYLKIPASPIFQKPHD